MSKQQKIGIAAGVLCVLMLIGILLFGLWSRRDMPAAPADSTENRQETSGQSTESKTESTTPGNDSTNPATDTTAPPDSEEPAGGFAEETTQSSTEETTPPTTDQQTTDQPPVDVPPSVVIPGKDEETGLTFPCEVPGHDLVIEKMAPYTGLFVEDGTNTQRTDVAMLLIRNRGNQPLEYAQIAVKFSTEILEFYLSALPAGEGMVVQERSGKSIPAGVPLEATVLAVHRQEMSIAPEVSVKDNGDNSFTVQNLTDEEIPAVRIFYKYYMEEESLYVGGIAFNVKISRLPANGKMVIRPSHYLSHTGRVVMVLIYDTDK